MAIKLYKPTTASRRKTSILINKDLNQVRPLKSLRVIKKKQAGRNNQGKITVRHQGGGVKRYIRLVDFKMDKFDIPAKIETIEFDPNRNASIALLVYADGARRYILAPEHLKVGDKIMSSKNKVAITPGNRSTLKNIPTGTTVCNVEMIAGKGGQLARSAGNSVILSSIDNGQAQLKLPSGEIRIVSEECSATIGTISNTEFRNVRWGKAGRMRHLGIRPTVRGKVMNPVDHPHGGGEGHNPIGLKSPKTYTGKKAYGIKTRKAKNASNKFIVKRRKSRQTTN